MGISYEQRGALERKAILEGELLRRQGDDALLSFEAFSPQREFIDAVIRGVRKENYYIGANRSGKSDAGAYAGSFLARFGNQDPNLPYIRAKGSNIEVKDRATSGWVSDLDFPTSRDVIQPK